ARERRERFLGKVQPDTAQCRGGERGVAMLPFPWIDWQQYWGTGDAKTLSTHFGADIPIVGANSRGVFGAMLDLEYQRMELIKFNLFDNGGTYQTYVEGDSGRAGPAVRRWALMKLPPGNPHYAAVGGDAAWQMCNGELIRHRELTGICNDIQNPAMGS